MASFREASARVIGWKVSVLERSLHFRPRTPRLLYVQYLAHDDRANFNRLFRLR